MITIQACNESAAAEELFAQDIDIGAFFHAFCRKLGASVSAAQAKAIMKEMDIRYSRKAVLDIWEKRGELNTEESFGSEFAAAVKEVYGVKLSDVIQSLAEKHGCDTRLDGTFIRAFGNIYFNDAGMNAIIIELQLRKGPNEFARLPQYAKA